jgi:nardilysin
MIFLTQKGLEKVEDVIDAVGSYILLIEKSGVDKSIFHRFKGIRDIKFRFGEESSVRSIVTDSVKGMALYEPRDIITGDELIFEFDENLLKSVAKIFNDRKFNTVILTQNYENFDKQEKWSRARYAEVDFPEKLQQIWDNRTVKDEMSLPQDNPYLCSNFELVYNKPIGKSVPVRNIFSAFNSMSLSEQFYFWVFGSCID